VKVLKEHLTKHIVVGPTINFIKKSDPFEKSYRNLLAQHYPEDKTSAPQTRHFQLTKPRLSVCKEFLEEDIALLESPDRQLGIAHTPLSKTDKFWLTQASNGVEQLLESLIINKKKVPTLFLLR